MRNSPLLMLASLIWDRASAGSPLKAAAARRTFEVGMAGTCSVVKGKKEYGPVEKLDSFGQ